MTAPDDEAPRGRAMTRRAFALSAAVAPFASAQGRLPSISHAAGALPYAAFEYPRPKFEIRETKSEKRDGAVIRDITYVNTWNQRAAAYLVEPQRRARGATSPGILWVHWYEPEAKDSNRTQFLEQAVELAHDGAVSLLPETMWSDPEWFKKRKPEEDYQKTLHQVHELRRALDLLEAQKRVLGVAYVGHDFGAMFGAVLAGADSRPKVYALQAGAPRFSDWYLLGRKLDDAARRRVMDQFAPLDPVRYIGRATPSRVLFQFGRSDPYVPEASARAFLAACREPKDVLWYDAGHALSAGAVRDRQEWLRKYLFAQGGAG